jgi:hypothetical protein
MSTVATLSTPELQKVFETVQETLCGREIQSYDLADNGCQWDKLVELDKTKERLSESVIVEGHRHEHLL